VTARWDETWHRLREWTNDQGPSERLAAQILIKEGFVGLDPSHPLGGKDGGRDATCTKDGLSWVMAVYFPRGQQTFRAISQKFDQDLRGARANEAEGMAFVTNQELSLSEREALQSHAAGEAVELYHLERITALLDSPEMAAVRKQFLGIDYEEAGAIILGGEGGRSPGAGGGGGGALGSGARGGDGGPGGRITFQGKPGRAPGAGGGGAGAAGEGAVGAQGGGGGDYVNAEISREELEQLRAAGFDHVEFKVGRGGEAGGPGEDTIANFVTADGRVLRSIVAHGGQGGQTGKGSVIARQACAGDLQKGFAISFLLLADVAQVRNGLVYLLGGGWEFVEFTHAPFKAEWPLVCCLSMGDLDLGSHIELFAVVRDPTGFQVLQESFVVTRNYVAAVSRPILLVPLRFSGSKGGVWTVAIASGGVTLAELPIEIRLRN
jgi:hypothetical protein